MDKFDTKVQLIKYKVLKEVAKTAWNDGFLNVLEIPKIISPGKTPTMRCCIYKERAIVSERVKYALGGKRNNNKVIQVIDIACEDCPAGGYEVTPSCRGCLAHRCEEACKKGAISFGLDQKAYIDKNKCVNCGLCASVCPYHAIINYKRPCETSCKVNAISTSAEKEAVIDYDKCTACGACAYACPFGAITDRSYILDAIDLIKKSDNGKNYNIYALVAPAISSQFKYVKLGQVFTAILSLGFTHIKEVALGADMIAQKEALELVEKGFLISSCCPSFVTFIEKNYPELKQYITKNLSPLGTLASCIKKHDKTAKIVFIGPCTAKKCEFIRPEYSKIVDCVITFEELQALIDSKEIDMEKLEETNLDEASYFGRIFARSGGVSEAVSSALKDTATEFEVKPISCSGLDECKTILQRASKGLLPYNFIEGMACIGGCINGAGNITHSEKNKIFSDNYAKTASSKTTEESLKKLL